MRKCSADASSHRQERRTQLLRPLALLSRGPLHAAVPTLRAGAVSPVVHTSEPVHPLARRNAAHTRHGVESNVTHLEPHHSELGAPVAMNNEGPLAVTSAIPEGLLDAITSSRIRETVAARDVRLHTYRRRIEKQGLHAMRRPRG